MKDELCNIEESVDTINKAIRRIEDTIQSLDNTAKDRQDGELRHDLGITASSIRDVKVALGIMAKNADLIDDKRIAVRMIFEAVHKVGIIKDLGDTLLGEHIDERR